MKYLILVAMATVVGLSACSSGSGPTFTMNELDAADGMKTYQVKCGGVFSSIKRCEAAAQRVCGDKPVRFIETQKSYQPKSQADEMTFQCGAPPTSEPPTEAPAMSIVPTPTPTPTPVPETKRVVLTGGTYFETNSAALTARARAVLDKLLKEQGEGELAQVKITGHTDSTGSRALNERLSRHRAESVANYLKQHGLQSKVWQVAGAGSEAPVASNATLEGRAKNRRVEIVLQP